MESQDVDQSRMARSRLSWCHSSRMWSRSLGAVRRVDRHLSDAEFPPKQSWFWMIWHAFFHLFSILLQLFPCFSHDDSTTINSMPHLRTKTMLRDRNTSRLSLRKQETRKPFPLVPLITAIRELPHASVHGVSRIMEGSASSLQELEKKFGNLGDGARQPSRCHEVPLMAAPKSQLNGWVATGFGSSWKTFASAILWPAPCPVLAQ